jgi:thiol-disulfide isomerase/thioredoxin
MKKETLILVTVAGIAGVIAWFGISTFLSREPAAPGAAPMADSSATRPDTRKIPGVLPDFTLATLEGPPRTLSSFTQPSLIVNFWATWCAPCRREIPLLRQLRTERAAQGVEVVGVAVDFREDVIEYASDINLDYPLLIGEEEGFAAADSFGINPVFPFTVFADAERRIVAVKIGELHADEAGFILDHVQKINAGTMPVETARNLIRDELRRLEAARSPTAGG